MKQRFGFYLFCAAVMLLLPAGVCNAKRSQPPPEHTALSGSYRILCTKNGEISEIPLREYLIGAVGAEMPASYEPEALKAQVIACHTYAERVRNIQQKTPDPALCGADLSDDCTHYQAYYNKDALRSLYCAKYDEYRNKLENAVDAVGDLLLCYDGEPIVAAFHAVSAGQTEAAETVWGTALPYLVSVDSAADCDAPDFLETVCIPAETVRKTLFNAEPDCVFSVDPAEWFAQPQISDAGTVRAISVGGVLFDGQRLREVLALRSAAFTVQFADGAFQFTTKGFGHDVGMSQFGANALAKQGADYTEILAHYYPNTVLCPMPD